MVAGLGWIHARDLTAGDQLVTAADDDSPAGTTRLEAIDVERLGAAHVVYNFTVYRHHTYYVVAGGSWILVHNSGGYCKEEVLGAFDDFPQARNRALELLGEINPATRRPYYGRLSSADTTYGKLVGFETRVGETFKRFRLDYDPVKGPHINVEIGRGAGAKKWAVPWKGSESDFARILGGNT